MIETEIKILFFKIDTEYNIKLYELSKEIAFGVIAHSKVYSPVLISQNFRKVTLSQCKEHFYLI